MPVALTCPSCGAPISESAVVALAPICTHCRVVLTTVGGSLGLTGAFGVGDPTITRRRIEADLAVLREYGQRYRSMKEACQQQLTWGVEKYARLPSPPELLPLVEVPSFWGCVVSALPMAVIWMFGSFVFLLVVAVADSLFFNSATFPSLHTTNVPLVMYLIVLGGAVVITLLAARPHFHAKQANGNRPLDNARRQRAYEEAVAASLRDAEPIKLAEDHRLRVQIREVESNAVTVAEMEAEVRRLLS